MTRIKILLAVLCTVAIVAMVPAGQAQEQACLNAGAANGTAATCEVHVVGDGSSAQFLQAGVAADALALSVPGVVTQANCSTNPSAQTTFHWTYKNGANIIDTRNVAIDAQLGNIWVVWLASCSDLTGATNITDIWTDVSEDSTVGVRTFYAQTTTSGLGGAQIQELEPGGTASSVSIKPQALWPDNTADVALPLPAAGANPIGGALGTSSTPTPTSNLFVNVGLTDIRPEDALFATDRSNSALTATLTGLGYTTANSNVGALISTAQGTGTSAQPVNFGLSGGTDPITGFAVRPSVTIPIGAAPVAFIFNNAGATEYPIDVETGVEPYEKAPSTDGYPLAHLFDGTTDCNTANAAFDVWYNAGAVTSTPPTTPANIYLVLREPLSGTMNTTEFNLFRTYGNSKDSQEVGVGGLANDPLNLPCAGGGNNRERAIGTGEVVNAILGTGNSENASGNVLGYIFYSFVNAAKFKGASTYNYLTIDGVDPIGQDPTTGDFNECQGGTAPNNDAALCSNNSQCVATGAGGVAGSCAPVSNIPQLVPNCGGPCPVGYFAGGFSFPNLRNGTYKPWSIYRWVVQSDIENETDLYGPAHLAYATDNIVDSTDADFVPFAAGYTCQGGTAPNNDGQYCYNSAHCVSTGAGGVAGQCEPTPGVIPDSLEVYRSHFQRCTQYELTAEAGMSLTCVSGQKDTPANGPESVDYALGGTGSVCTGGAQPNNDGSVCQSTAQCLATGPGGTAGTCTNVSETGGDVGGLVIGPLTPPAIWCPFNSKKVEEVKATPGSTTITWDAAYLFGPINTADAKLFELNLNLVPGNTIYIDGADYVIESVTNDKTLTIDRPYFTDNGGTATVVVPACFELNWPGPIGLYN